jgi:hypothetical protein
MGRRRRISNMSIMAQQNLFLKNEHCIVNVILQTFHRSDPFIFYNKAVSDRLILVIKKRSPTVENVHANDQER